MHHVGHLPRIICFRQTAENLQDCDYVTKCLLQLSCVLKLVYCAMRIEDGLEDHKFLKVFVPLADHSGRVVLGRRSATVLLLISRVRIPPTAWMGRLLCLLCVV